MLSPPGDGALSVVVEVVAFSDDEAMGGAARAASVRLFIVAIDEEEGRIERGKDE